MCNHNYVLVGDTYFEIGIKFYRFIFQCEKCLNFNIVGNIGSVGIFINEQHKLEDVYDKINLF